MVLEITLHIFFLLLLKSIKSVNCTFQIYENETINLSMRPLNIQLKEFLEPRITQYDVCQK